MIMITDRRGVLTFVATTLLAAFVSTSCSSMRPVTAVSAPTAPREYLDIKPGDVVSVERTDGRRKKFRVKSADNDALIAEGGQRYARSEMRELKREHFSHAKTWSLVATALIVVGVLYSIGAAAGDVISF